MIRTIDETMPHIEPEDVTEVTATTERQRGANLVEYALLMGLIAIVCVVAVTALGQTTAVPYSSVGSAIGG